MRAGRVLIAVAMMATLAVAILPARLSAQEATPAAPPPAPPRSDASAASERGVLTELLALAPDVLASPEPPQQVALFGDVAGQLAAVGAGRPTSVQDETFRTWIQATRWIPVPDPARSHGIQPEFRDLFGFDLLQIDQSLEVGMAPSTIIFLRGEFDPAELRTAWTAAGYNRLDVDGTEVYSLFEEPEFDFANPVSQIALARFNNALILEEDTIVFAPSLDLMRSVLAVVAGNAPSLAQNEDVAALLGTIASSLAGAMVVTGEVLQQEAMVPPSASAEAAAQIEAELSVTGELPPVRLALFGVTPGGPLPTDEQDATPVGLENPASYSIRLLVGRDADAENALAIIEQRLDKLLSLVSRQPYRDLLTLREASVSEDGSVILLDLDFGEERLPSLWIDLLFQRDLLFLAW
jgi:hypothetical protein